MTEIILCAGLFCLLFGLFFMFGITASRLLRLKMSGGMCLLLGVFVYYGIFQLAAVPMIMLKRTLSQLSLVWMVTLVAAAAVFLIAEHRYLREDLKEFVHPPAVSWIKIIMALLVLGQMFYITTSAYLGWDTAAYVGTIATSIQRNSMYLYNGESGRRQTVINFRYALSGFYMHGAVWCRILGIRALYYAKLVQGGMLAVLANCAIFRLGIFFFKGKQYTEYLEKRKAADCAAGMVCMAVLLNIFYTTSYTTSEFLMSRALEAKGYCANLVLPCIFLGGLSLWRSWESRENKVFFFAAAASSVAISMSSLIIVPAFVTLLLIPVIVRQRKIKVLGYYLICILPNLVYAVLYLLYTKSIFRIGV